MDGSIFGAKARDLCAFGVRCTKEECTRFHPAWSEYIKYCYNCWTGTCSEPISPCENYKSLSDIEDYARIEDHYDFFSG